MLGAVHLLEVAHDGGKRLCVRRLVLRGIGGKHFDRLAVRVTHARKACAVGLDPPRRITHLPVLPGPKPQQMSRFPCARPLHQRVHLRKMELALDRLYRFPVHRG